MKKIMFVEDDKKTLVACKRYLEMKGYEVITAENGKEALEKIHTAFPDIIILDLKMPVMNGFEALHEIRVERSLPFIPIIALSTLDQSDDIKKALELGADEFLVKPLDELELETRIKAMLRLKEATKREILQRQETSKLEQANKVLRNRVLPMDLKYPEAFSSMVTRNCRMGAIFKYIESIAKNSASVLIMGETGVGKELCAKAIHEVSGRKGKFVAVNIAGLDESSFIDTLFGHIKGAFTGADRERKGLVESADSGTIFFDEIGDLGSRAQIKLLRFLQGGEYFQLGSDTAKFHNTRVVLATNRDLRSRMAQGKLRPDLYFRLKVHEILVPPLRERTDDIPLLLDHLVEKVTKKLKKNDKPMVPPNLHLFLSKYHFPGNVRELENMVFKAVSYSRNGNLSMAPFMEALKKQENEPNLTNSKMQSWGSSIREAIKKSLKKGTFPGMREIELLTIEAAMQRAKGNQKIAARLLGISCPTLAKRLSEKRNLALMEEEGIHMTGDREKIRGRMQAPEKRQMTETKEKIEDRGQGKNRGRGI